MLKQADVSTRKRALGSGARKRYASHVGCAVSIPPSTG